MDVAFQCCRKSWSLRGKGVIERLELTDFISLSMFVILLPWSLKQTTISIIRTVTSQPKHYWIRLLTLNTNMWPII